MSNYVNYHLRRLMEIGTQCVTELPVYVTLDYNYFNLYYKLEIYSRTSISMIY